MTTAPRNAPGGTALIVIDMINRLAFDGGDDLRAAAETAVTPILALRDAADRAGVPVIYVNDPHDDWLDDRTGLVGRVLEEDCPGREIARRLRPRTQDYFVIKPQFSGFYATTLPALLPRLGVNRLVLTGIAADICVLFTAADAHMREYPLWVPEDAVAGEQRERTHWALAIMRNSMNADTRPTAGRTLDQWLSDGR